MFYLNLTLRSYRTAVSYVFRMITLSQSGQADLWNHAVVTGNTSKKVKDKTAVPVGFPADVSCLQLTQSAVPYVLSS